MTADLPEVYLGIRAEEKCRRKPRVCLHSFRRHGQVHNCLLQYTHHALSCRDPAPTQAAPAARPTEPVEPPQPAGDNPEDEKIKGWADLLVKYSVERDLDWAKSAITRILIPRGVDSKIFNDIFLAAVEKREVRQDTTLVSLMRHSILFSALLGTFVPLPPERKGQSPDSLAATP